MGKLVTTTFVLDNIHVPTEKVGCLQVTSKLQEFLNHFPLESKEKAFEQIYKILQVLGAYLIDNPQQHLSCMSPDSEYVSLIMYTTKLEINLGNFSAIWAVLSILLDTQNNELQYIKNLQQVVNHYYDKHPTEVMSRLEHETTDIMNKTYDSVTNDNLDSVSDYTDRVSGAVNNDTDRNDKDEMPYDNDKDEIPYDNDKDEMPYDSDDNQMPYEYGNDNDTAIPEVKNDRNMTNDDLNYVGTKDVVPYIRDDSMMTKVKRPIETGDVDNEFVREYDSMHKSMEDRQINDYYEAQRHIQSTMKGDTPIKTGQNRQCIDNITDYDREHNRIYMSVHHRLDLGHKMLPGAQQYTTVESAVALKIQENGQKDKMGKDNIGIFEFIFHGLPEPPELEGIDEDRLRELQNAVQEQLRQRDEERERNITKRVQEFEKTFDFVNPHLLKGVATMAELTKTENRQPMGKIKPTDKMVMMLSLFDGTKPSKSKQHYERFNLYINFQTKSGHLTDPVQEGIDLFEHTLDKTALVWFQMNRSKFKDLTMLKTMFLQRYNPWGKTKGEQLQSWNILSFNPKTTDVDEHIDLINTLSDMVDQKEEAKKEKFIETMPTMIQTHLITCKDWAVVKDTAKSLEHIILKYEPPTPAMPTMATGATTSGLYSHIAH